MTAILRAHLAEFSEDFEHLHDCELFVIDLWVSNRVCDMLDFWDEIVVWLEESAIEHEWHILTLSTRLVAIRDPDAAFLFTLRFR